MVAHRCLSAGVVALLCAASAGAQTWEYKSYKKDSMGRYDKANYVSGTIEVEQKGGESFFRMNSGRVDVCYRGALPASVEKTEATTIIEVSKAVSGCEEFRYTIRNDGSGGFKETKRGDQWVRSQFDHGLTPVK